MKSEYHHIRKQYTKGKLDVSNVSEIPADQLEIWIRDATDAGCPEPTAMILSTAGTDLKPSSRVVLMKGIDERGILFYSNYLSRKGMQLGLNPHASLLFFWPEVERQVRIEGRVSRIPDKESDTYFDSRPVQSRISAIVSPQSQEIPSREFLEERKRLVEADGVSVARPENWGGYLFDPEYFEFWQGREDRLHDRIFYRKKGMNWITGRLAP